MKILIFLIALIMGLSSCTSYRSLEDERLKRAQAEKDRLAMQVQYDAMKVKIDSTENLRQNLIKQMEIMRKDTAMVNSSLRNYIRLDNENKLRMEQLSKTTDRILDANINENDRLSGQIKLQKEDLIRQQAELEKNQAEYERQKAELEQQKANFQNAQGALGTKESRIRELQAALERKDQAVKDLQKKVAEALVGFKASGLDVVERNGKVYVLMPEALLFKSGSKTIDAKGRDAIKQLAYILNANPDINIAVEGHTDNVPYRPKTANALVEDNWDLSVLRATSVVKELTNVGVSPLRIAAQGRGEYLPINTANTKEGRAVNRRTEIILTPKLEELLKSIE